MTRTQSLWWGTLTLTVAALLARGLGMVYRVLLARYLGAEGLGLFQMVFPFYITLVTLVAAGMPVAVSQMAAEGRAAPADLWRDARRLTLWPALILMVLVVALSRPLATVLYQRPDLARLLVALTPALFMVAIGSVLRGLFIARQAMVIPAISQVLEQSVRIVLLMAALAAGVLPFALDGPILAAWLIPVGEFASLAVLWIGRASSGLSGRPRAASVTRGLLALAAPVTLSRLLASLVGLAEASLIPLRLEASGLSSDAAVRYFGQLMGMAFPLIFFPTALTFSLATNLVPAVARSLADARAVRRRAEEAMRGTAIWACPVTALLVMLGNRLDDLLFRTTLPGYMFLPLALGGFFMYFDIILAGLLRGLGRTEVPLTNSLIAASLQLGLIVLFGGEPGLGPPVITLAMATGFFVSFVLDLRALERVGGIRLPWIDGLTRPLLAAGLASLSVPLFTRLLVPTGLWLTTLGALFGAGSFYLILIRALGVRLRMT